MDKTEKAAKIAKPIRSEGPSSKQQMLTLQQALDLALHHHTVGNLSKAENVYQEILQTNPSHPDALHLLGVIAHQGGANDHAVDLIQCFRLRRISALSSVSMRLTACDGGHRPTTG